MNIDALYNLTHGVYVLGADDGGRPVGSAVDAVMQVASKPKRPLFSMQLYQKLH